VKYIYQAVPALLFSIFSLTASAQVVPADDCVSQTSNAYDFLNSALDSNSVEVTCLTNKGATEMYVTWNCPPEIDAEADYILIAAVTKNVGGLKNACYVYYGPQIGNTCHFGSEFRPFALSGKEVSATRRELADFCASKP